MAWRGGAPRIVALAYFGLGDTEQESRRNMLHYYEPMGEEVATLISDGVLRSPEAVRAAVQGYQEARVDELVLDPSVADPDQVDLLADVAVV